MVTPPPLATGKCSRDHVSNAGLPQHLVTRRHPLNAEEEVVNKRSAMCQAEMTCARDIIQSAAHACAVSVHKRIIASEALLLMLLGTSMGAQFARPPLVCGMRMDPPNHVRKAPHGDASEDPEPVWGWIL